MTKIKTEETSFAVGSGWTHWDFNEKYNYSVGICYAKKGLIYLYHEEGTTKNPHIASAEIVKHIASAEIVKHIASAEIVKNGRCYVLHSNSKVTRIGWVRIAKRWARAKR